ncbi:MAG: T9SS type A sorting domain-containing protein [Bacteroidota bacterium]
MIKKIILIFFQFSFLLTESQNWDSVRGGVFNKQLERVLFDSVHNTLIVSSKFVNRVGSIPVRGICSFDGYKWDSLSSGINSHDKVLNPSFSQGMALACIPYQGKLLVGGMYQSIGGINATSLALWDGVKWDSLSKRAFRFNDNPVQVSGFLRRGNLLYLTGNFDTIAGQPSKGLAIWDGTNFSSVSLPIGSGFQNISSIIEYQNDIYIAGDGFLIGSNNNARDIFKFNGSNWVSTTGTGVLGNFSGIADLEIYNNELYACGHFTKADGNPADNIMKWNGSQWQDIGFGNDLSAFVSIKKMLVHNNKLWVFGGFYKAANGFASMAASYDGTNWCGLKDTLDNIITTATIYNDTIFIGGGFWTANSDSLHFLGKLKDENLYNQCINAVSVKVNYFDSVTSIYPNPTTSIVNILNEQNEFQNSTIEIKNYLGQSIFTSVYSPAIDFSLFSPGMYFLIIKDKPNWKAIKIIKE